MAVGLLGGLGGLGAGAAGGGIMGTLSTIGSVLGAISSFIPKDTPDVPMPPPVNLGTATELPSTTYNDTAASAMTEEQRQQMEANEKRRRMILNGQSPDEMDLVGEAAGTPKVKKVTLLGG